MMKIVAEFENGLKQYPPIAPGTLDPYSPPKSADKSTKPGE
jgi:arylsulfatase